LIYVERATYFVDRTRNCIVRDFDDSSFVVRIRKCVDRIGIFVDRAANFVEREHVFVDRTRKCVVRVLDNSSFVDRIRKRVDRI
jgi:hypothetical protein